jgi:hypothetical protein
MTTAGGDQANCQEATRMTPTTRIDLTVPYTEKDDEPQGSFTSKVRRRVMVASMESQ